MPMSRYEIRNEYTLADPDLYRAADKDDPEALLEGVAMAGLVGVLRQLGDLAEFAAEIFHDLHEEVMATSARGHGLMIRVQQLESETPSIEKAFLSQTDHSSFFYNAGVDWRSNLRLDQNLVTQGDLPRFIMDSYEECRGPPRLFLLDKFDVAGAGACLKRFTDPSFFKIENTADVQREKKIRKTKKKGPRWRNGGTPEVLPSAHAKLHQLFLEERVENGVTNPSNPARRVKLKRRLNGFPFDLRTGKSYMEKVLQNPSPEHTIHEVSMSSALVVLRTNDHIEPALDLVKFEPVSPQRDSMERNISPILPYSSTYEQNEVFRDDKVREVSNSHPCTVSDEISSYALGNVNGEKDVHVGGESKTEDSNGYESDGISCEIDNYVDAPSTMGSDVDTDSELRGKGDFASAVVKTQPAYANEDLQTHSSDSHSTAEPTMSEGNNSSKKETSTFSSSGSLGNSAENPHADTRLSTRISSADIDLVDDASSYQKISDGDFSLDQHLNHGVPEFSCTNKDTITSSRSDIEQLPSSLLCSGDSVSMLSHSDSEEVVREDMTRECEIEDGLFTLNAEGRKTIIDPSCSPSVLDPEFQSGDDYLISQANVDDEPNSENLPHTSTVTEIIGHKDSSDAMYSDLLHGDASDHENLTRIENSDSLNMSNAFSQGKYDVPETNFTEIPGADKLDGDASEWTENVFSECPDVAANGVVSLSREEVFVGGKLTDTLDNIFNDDSNCVSHLNEASHDKKLSEASFSKAEEHQSSSSIDNQVGSENIISPSAEKSPDWPEDVIDSHDMDGSENIISPSEEKSPDWREDVIDSHDRDVVEEESTINESCDVLGLQGPEVTDDLFTKNSADIGKTSSTGEILEEEAGLTDSVEDDGFSLYTDPNGVVDDLVSVNVKCLNDYDCEVEQLETADTDSASTDGNDSATGGPHKWVEVHTLENSDSATGGPHNWVEVHTLENSDRNEIQDGSNSLSERQRDPGVLEKVGQGEAASSHSTTSVFCHDTDNGHLKLEESDSFPNPEVYSNFAHNLDLVDDITTELLQMQRGFDREQGTAQQSVPDSKFEELVSVEKIESQNHQLNEELLDSQEISLGQSPILVADPQQMPDHDDDCEEYNYSGSVFPLVNYSSPPSFPPSNMSYETNEINLDELPPLPPLPPVQWRMGKFLQASSTTGESEEITNHKSVTSITSLPDGYTNSTSISEQQIDHSLVQIAPEIALKEEELEHEARSDTNFMNETTELPPEIENKQMQPTTSSSVLSPLEDTNHALIQIDLAKASSGEKLENALNSEEVNPEITSKEDELEREARFHANYMNEATELQPEIESKLMQPTSSSSVLSSLEDTNHSLIQIDLENASSGEKLENAPNNEKVESVCIMDKNIDLQPEINKEHQYPMSSHNDVNSSLEEMNVSSVQINLEPESEQEKVQPSSSTSEANAVPETKVIPHKVENEQLKRLLPFTARELPVPPVEGGVSNGIRLKVPRAPNPLFEDVAALDKSKLRKVTERVRPQLQKVDERDSLLEQIRTKSFNLKPASASRPSIQGPRTNLKVAAILEKANQIRQAFAGSDEDDEDNWSDS